MLGAAVPIPRSTAAIWICVLLDVGSSVDPSVMDAEPATAQEAHRASAVLPREPPRQLFDTWEEYLDFAASGGTMNEVRFALMAGGADINQQLQQASNATPLIRAADQGHTELVAMFLKAGAKMELRTMDGETALMRAAANNHAEAVRELMQAGARADTVGDLDFTPLRMAASRGHDEAMQIMVESSPLAMLNGRDTKGRTALMYAAGSG